MSKPVFTASKESSAAYFNALDEYMEDKVLHPDKGFICKHEKACRESCRPENRDFYPGQLHHVGKYYDLQRNGKPFRVVVSGAEYGYSEEKVTLQSRTAQINDLRPSNPHMRGTLFLLQMLFGEEPSDSQFSIEVNGGQESIFKAFSLANFLLCSAIPAGQEFSTNAYTDSMQRNCRDHYREMLDFLRPQIVVLQGQRSWHYFSDCHNIQLDHANAKIEKIDVGGESVLVLPLYHPYQPNEKHWGDVSRPAVRDYAKPAVENLLKEYEKIYG